MKGAKQNFNNNKKINFNPVIQLLLKWTTVQSAKIDTTATYLRTVYKKRRNPK